MARRARQIHQITASHPACAECAAEVESLRGTAAALASAVPQRTPPPHLRERVLGSFSKTQAAPPAGKSYQLWVVPAAGAPISAGLVVPDPMGGGMTYFYTPPDIPRPPPSR